jgi:hypothetical protein
MWFGVKFTQAYVLARFQRSKPMLNSAEDRFSSIVDGLGHSSADSVRFFATGRIVAFDEEVVRDLSGSVASLVPLTLQRLCSDRRAAGGLKRTESFRWILAGLETLLGTSRKPYAKYLMIKRCLE